jgi:hypothetical protein
MKKTNEQKLNEKFEYLFYTYVYGNYSEIKNFIKNSKKKEIIKFFKFLNSENNDLDKNEISYLLFYIFYTYDN